jgi:hypothetical protein
MSIVQQGRGRAARVLAALAITAGMNACPAAGSDSGQEASDAAIADAAVANDAAVPPEDGSIEDSTSPVADGGDAASDADAYGSECSWGTRDGSTECLRLTPMLVAADSCDQPGTTDLIDQGAITAIDTGQGCDAIVVQGEGAPEVCVRKFSTVNITGTLNVSGPRALSIVATHSLVVAGLLHAGARQSVPGPGAPDPRGAGGSETHPKDGAGGAGHATRGGVGATEPFTWPPTNNNGGFAYQTEATLPLVGGASGGSTDKDSTGATVQPSPYGAAGAGGGALQLVSCGTLAITGNVTVGGGGGGGGYATGNPASYGGSFWGGAGGGSGGTVVIEAPELFVSGGVFANGGGGGGGGVLSFPNIGMPSSAGRDGTLSATEGASGGSAFIRGAPGGSGAYGNRGPGWGEYAFTIGANGAGGGAAGRIHLRLGSGATPGVALEKISPPPTLDTAAFH